LGKKAAAEAKSKKKGRKKDDDDDSSVVVVSDESRESLPETKTSHHVERAHHGEQYQYLCGRCLQGFHSEDRHRAHHRAQCIFCPGCGDYHDQRHIDKCVARSDEEKERAKAKMPVQVVCPLCFRLRSGHNLHSHYKSKHGITKKSEMVLADQCMEEVMPLIFYHCGG